MTLLDEVLIAWGALNLFVFSLATLSWCHRELTVAAFDDRHAADQPHADWQG